MTDDAIRLVGGPFDSEMLSAGPDGSASAGGLVACVRGTERVELDAVDADGVTTRWRGVQYAVEPPFPLSFTKRLHYAGTFLLRTERASSGVRIVLGARLHDGDAHPSAASSAWRALTAIVEENAARFAEAIALLDPGPIADRAVSVAGAVSQHVDEARRLAHVGETVDPGWRPGDVAARAERLAGSIAELADSVDDAVTEAVALHLAVNEDRSLRDPAAELRVLRTSLGEARSQPPG